MGHYIERLNDGTVRTVKYNPRHDGPVSERITTLNRIRWLSKWCRRHPADNSKKQELTSQLSHLKTISSNRNTVHQERPQKRKHLNHRLSWNAKQPSPNRTSKAFVPQETANRLQTQQRQTAAIIAQHGNANHCPQ
jgi:hypothetical protein